MLLVTERLMERTLLAKLLVSEGEEGGEEDFSSWTFHYILSKYKCSINVFRNTYYYTVLRTTVVVT
jgi:hypothetical protein